MNIVFFVNWAQYSKALFSLLCVATRGLARSKGQFVILISAVSKALAACLLLLAQCGAQMSSRGSRGPQHRLGILGPNLCFCHLALVQEEPSGLERI